jgi:hypothetical protein
MSELSKKTEEVLHKYSDMQFIIDSTDEKIKETEVMMIGVKSPSLDGMPKIHNPNAHEERILKGTEQLDVLQERYQKATTYMSWVKPAFSQLSDDEQFILTEFYLSPDRSIALYTVSTYFHVERSTVYARKSKALDHLSTLLYGR